MNTVVSKVNLAHNRLSMEASLPTKAKQLLAGVQQIHCLCTTIRPISLTKQTFGVVAAVQLKK